jgi:hypothetical protein
MDALGSTTERIDLADWLTRISPDAAKRAGSSVDPNYFASRSLPGLARLRDHIQENAFWGKFLYGASAERYARLLGILAAFVVVVGFVAVPLAPRDQALLVSRILVAALSFGAVLTAMGAALLGGGCGVR